MRQCHLIAFGFDDVCFICCCHSNPIGVPSSSFGPSLFNTDLENSLWSEDTQTPSSIIILGIVADNLASCFSAFRFAFCVFSNRITNSWFAKCLKFVADDSCVRFCLSAFKLTLIENRLWRNVEQCWQRPFPLTIYSQLTCPTISNFSLINWLCPFDDSANAILSLSTLEITLG